MGKYIKKDESHQDYAGPIITIDLQDKADVIESLDLAFQYIKDFIKEGKVEEYDVNDKIESTFFAKKAKEDGYDEYGMEIISKVLDLYPDLESKALEWATFALGKGRGI